LKIHDTPCRFTAHFEIILEHSHRKISQCGVGTPQKGNIVGKREIGVATPPRTQKGGQNAWKKKKRGDPN